MVTGIHHVEMVVKDLERSIVFYRDLMGLEVMSRHAETEVDSQAMGLAGEEVRLKWAFLRAGNDLLELHQYLSPVGKPLSRRNCDVGPGHVTFEVADIEKLHRTLVQKGVRFNREPQWIEEGRTKGARWVYMQDPDGITVELYQLP